MGKRLRRTDLTGMKFGKLTVIEKAGYGVDKAGKRYALWKCKCECGNEKTYNQHTLVMGAAKSCGCMRKRYTNAHELHGLSRSRIYRTYYGMLYRCYSESDSRYSSYGGRGITVCDEWRGTYGFINFYNWAMENGYSDDLTIDRIDVNGNYEPSNCRWATREQQCNNQRTNVFYSVHGETLQMKQIVEKYHISETTLRSRMKRMNISMEEAVDYDPTSKNIHIEYKGESKTAAEWSKITGISQATLLYRLKQGYTEDEIFIPANVGYAGRRPKNQHYKEV